MTALKDLFGFSLLFRGARNQVQNQSQALRFFSWLFVLLVSSEATGFSPSTANQREETLFVQNPTEKCWPNLDFHLVPIRLDLSADSLHV